MSLTHSQTHLATREDVPLMLSSQRVNLLFFLNVQISIRRTRHINCTMFLYPAVQNIVGGCVGVCGCVCVCECGGCVRGWVCVGGVRGRVCVKTYFLLRM